jgi:LmbE family N-acetylglucosaminyl deacetylase
MPMTSHDLDVPARVLAVGAHPDDVEFGCGATLAKWASAGAHCELLVLTDGSKGSWDPAADTAELVATRQHEQCDAADEMGVTAVHFGGFVDGELEPSRSGRQVVCSVIRSARPDVILGHDPWKRYRLHPDHRAAGELLIDGLVAARDPHYFPDIGRPHRPSEMLLFEAEDVDHLESVDETALAAKIAALLAHRSQWRSTMHIDADAPVTEQAAQRDAFVRGVTDELTGAGSAALVERFKRIDDL